MADKGRKPKSNSIITRVRETPVEVTVTLLIHSEALDGRGVIRVSLVDKPKLKRRKRGE